MASKPTKYPQWASDGISVTEPLTSKKTTGWAVAEKPPAQEMNWLQNLVYQWTQYLGDLENQALTWNALQTFAGGILVALIDRATGLGALNLGTGSADGVSIGHTGRPTSINGPAYAQEGVDKTAGTGVLKVGVTTADGVTLSRTGQLTNVGGFFTATQGATFLDAMLATSIDRATGAGVLPFGAGTADGVRIGRSTKPVVVAGDLKTDQVSTAWARFTSGTASPTPTASRNIASIVVSSSRITITLATGFLSASDWIASANIVGAGGNAMLNCIILSGNTVDVYAYVPTGGVYVGINPLTNAMVIGFDAKGNQ